MRFPPAHRESVLELFRTLHSDNQGTGVGLAIVRRIIELHGLRHRVHLGSQGSYGGVGWMALRLRPAGLGG